ncbi:MAG: glycogen synthase GlgA [Woeseiaceae bacterium]
MAIKDPELRICMVSSEFAPFAKTGGLGDVVSALSRQLHGQGHDLRVLIPYYSRIRSAGLDPRPVASLTDLPMQLGDHTVSYSILRAALSDSDMPIFLLQCPEFFDRDGIYSQESDEFLRFVLLSRAAIEMCQRMAFAPHIMHCNDWQTALIPLYLRSTYAWDRLFDDTRSVLTIHNIGYQGIFPAYVLRQLHLAGAEHHLHQDDLTEGLVNFLKTGILYADLVTTVSPTYAREILGADYGMGLDHLLRQRGPGFVGILNGVDYGEWDPSHDTLIPANYDAGDLAGKTTCKRRLMEELGLEIDVDRPLIGIVSRLVAQKGFDLVRAVVPRLLRHTGFSLAVLGSGESRYESAFSSMAQQFPGKIAFYRGYNEQLAHWIEAGADMFLMPSRYEPCGLNQMYSLRYGTVPIVRETGGLADSVEQIDPHSGGGTGILFRDYDETGLEWALTTALGLYRDRDLWHKIMQNGMARDFSWQRQSARYVELYRQLGNRP